MDKRGKGRGGNVCDKRTDLLYLSGSQSYHWTMVGTLCPSLIPVLSSQSSSMSPEERSNLRYIVKP